MVKAIVKWYHEGKGYGFLDMSGKDVFVHHAAIISNGYKHCREGETVYFTLVSGRHGMQATNVYPAHTLDALQIHNFERACNDKLIGE